MHRRPAGDGTGGLILAVPQSFVNTEDLSLADVRDAVRCAQLLFGCTGWSTGTRHPDLAGGKPVR